MKDPLQEAFNAGFKAGQEQMRERAYELCAAHANARERANYSVGKLAENFPDVMRWREMGYAIRALPTTEDELTS